MEKERADGENRTTRDVRQWTVMVYMAAGDDADLDDYAVKNLREMEQGANGHVHVAVQIQRHWPDIPQRYVITRDGRLGKQDQQPLLDTRDSDMGKGATLAHFLEWALEECPANYYMLILWGHAYGLGFGRDHGDPLRLTELVDALTAFRKKRNELGLLREEDEVEGRKGVLDILGTNACAMSYVEAAYELRNSADYMIASQIYVPFAGWPYETVLQSISGETKPEQLGSNVLDAYVTGFNNPLSGERIEMSFLNLMNAKSLHDAINELAKAVRHAFNSEGYFDSSRRAAIRDSFLAAAAGDVRPLVDVIDLSRAMQNDLCDRQLNEFVVNALGISREKRDWLHRTEKNLKEKLIQMENAAKSLLVQSPAAHPTLGNLGGVGVYVPFVTDNQDLKRLGLEDGSIRSKRENPNVETSRTTYRKLAIFSGTERSWPSLVYDDLSEPIPEALAGLIAGIGVTSTNDRADMAQIILSIESAFNKLDRVLNTAATVVVSRLREMQAYTPPSDPNASPHSMFPQFGLALPALTAPKNANTNAGPIEITDPIEFNWFRRLEYAVEEVERTVKKGLTQARFGIGPVITPRGFDIVKTDQGAPPRDEHQGFDIVKTDQGPPPREATTFATADVLARQSDVRPVLQLFRRAADSLRGLERATSELERQVGQSHGTPVLERRDLPIRRAFEILREAATSARRTIRDVIANPWYGLGPSTANFDLDTREELANAAGMGARDLRLINLEPLAPQPGQKDLLNEVGT